MIEAHAFLDRASRRGFALWTGVPCSYLQPLINQAMADERTRYVHAANEGDAVAIAAGASLGGCRGVAMLQNSGLGNAVSPLTSLVDTHGMPVLLIVTLRGEPGGPADEPQHTLMGAITWRLLELMQVGVEYFPEDADAIDACLDRAVAHMARTRRAYCLVMRKDVVAPCPPAALPPQRVVPAAADAQSVLEPPTAGRADMLRAVLAAVGPRDLVVSTTGYTSRTLWALHDAPNHLYVVGAMGCASSVGLGLALARPDLRVIVIDGDGALLMRSSALAAIGGECPANLVHVVLDNGMHESTGGQTTAARWVDLPAMARANGYPAVVSVGEPSQLTDAVRSARSLTFVRARTTAGVSERLPRPTIAPPDVTERFREHVAGIPRSAP